MAIKTGILAFTLVVLFSLSGLAATETCEDLMRDLRAMQNAQHELLQSFSHKSGVVAQTLDQHANQLEKSLAAKSKLKKSDIDRLHVSAKAFRGHESREQQLVQRFEKATDRLLGQVESCWARQKGIASAE